jgi:hypothetical protein
MDTAIKLTPEEFNQEMFRKIKRIVGTLSPDHITISFSGQRKIESKEEYETRLLQANADLQAGKGVSFSMEELAAFIKEKS